MRHHSLPLTPSALTLLSMLLLGAAMLSGCNTAKGFGEDVEATGEAISDTAEETKEEITE